jgi:uncharacterized protein (DUF983 family)
MGQGFFSIRHHCPVCGVVFERDPGEVTGGMAINMVISSVLGVFLAIYGALFSRLNILVVVALLVAITLAFGLVFHRHARGLWVGFLYATGAIAER